MQSHPVPPHGEYGSVGGYVYPAAGQGYPPPAYNNSYHPPLYGYNSSQNSGPASSKVDSSSRCTSNHNRAGDQLEMEDEADSPFVSSSFNTTSIRHAFIRKVYMIMTAQLLVTLAFVAVFQFVTPMKMWVRAHRWFYYCAFIVFFVVYLALVCCESVRRKFPTNFIALAVFTVAFSYMTAAITSYHETLSVVYALLTTALLCIGLTIFAIQTRIDFTMCSGMLFVFSLVFMIFGFSVLILYYFVDHSTARILHLVYGALGALLFSMFLVFDTQMIMGGRKHDISPEEYILAALQLYLDVVFIFLFILSIFGFANGN